MAKAEVYCALSINFFFILLCMHYRSALHPSTIRQGAVLVGVLCALVVVSTILLRWDSAEPFKFARYDPGWLVSTTASLVEDGDIDLRNQLDFNPRRAQDQIALGNAGEWYPVHEYFLPLVAVPFFAAFGPYGCLLLNALLVIVTVLAMYFSCVRHVSSPSQVPVAILASLLMFASSPLRSLSFSFSLDVLSAALFSVTYYLVLRQRTALAGFIFGLMVWGRIITLVTLVAFLFVFFVQPWKESLRKVGSFLCGSLIPVLALLGGNFVLFGSPLLLPYMRWAPVHLVGGIPTLVLRDQAAEFSFPTLIDIAASFFHPSTGLFVDMPLFLAALLLSLRELPLLYRSIEGRLGSISIFALLLVLCASATDSPGVGRYLLPALAPASVLLTRRLLDFQRTTNAGAEAQGNGTNNV